MGHLGVGNPFHTAQYGVEENDAHADDNPGINIYFQIPGEDDPHAAHLSCYISERDKKCAKNRHYPCFIGIIPVSDKVRDSELPKFPKIRGQKKRQ